MSIQSRNQEHNCSPKQETLINENKDKSKPIKENKQTNKKKQMKYSTESWMEIGTKEKLLLF